MRRFTVGLFAALLSVPMAAAIAFAPAAQAENNGVGQTPALGWSSWSFVRHDPTAAIIEAQAKDMHTSGLQKAGFEYVNVDDFWYQCPGSQGPNVDQYGRWATDPTKFPSAGAENGIQVVADYVHSLGLKFGLYVTPGISHQAVVQNTAIEGTTYHADDIATAAAEKNYNCGGMVGIDYSKPGAQAFINSWANEFAGWGVDYVKIDGVGTSDVPDIAAWSTALRQTGRPIHLELSNSLAIGSASTWAQYSNGWRTGGDIECYCGSGGSSYPLTDWSNVDSRFDQVADWAPDGGPGAFNDYDSLEVGNGANDGLTPNERQTQLSLWALASSPLILGTDLTHLDATDLGYLRNTAVLAVDQDAIDAKRISSSSTTQVFAKTESGGDVVVGLFNTGGSTRVVSTTASALALGANSAGYDLDNLWTHRTTETAGAISASVPAHGVALLRVTTAKSAVSAPPNTTLALTGLTSVSSAQPVTATATFTNDGVLPVAGVRVNVTAPRGWTVRANSRPVFGLVRGGQSVSATFQVTAPGNQTLFQTDTVSGSADFAWFGSGRDAGPQRDTTDATVIYSPPVTAPFLTYSSATDAAAQYGESGTQFGVSGAGPDLYSDSDAYTTVYQPGVVGADSTVQTEVVSTANLSGYGKTGIIVRNSMTASGAGPEGVILFDSPEGGIQLEWDSNGGDFIDSVTPPNGTITEIVPVYLKLVRAGASYTGYYSTDGTTWTTVGTATVPDQATTQDAGLFVTSHTAGSPAQSIFDGFGVTG